MRILLVTRLFSGLRASVCQGKWMPQGIPAIYKLIEYMDQDPAIELHVVFAGMELRDCQNGFRGFRRTLPPLNSQITVLPFFGTHHSCLRFFERIHQAIWCRFTGLGRFCHFIRLLFLVIACRYDVIYCDRTQVGFAGFCARVLRKRVVLRLLGVYSDMLDLVSRPAGGWYAMVLRWWYAAPFAGVVCSQDGSGGEVFIDKAIRNKETAHLLFNGVDPFHVSEDEMEQARSLLGITREQVVVAFVGKLEPHKGIRDFVESMISLRRECSDFHALIIGDGPLRCQLEERVAQAGVKDSVSFAGLVPHAEVQRYLALSDIYVTLNREGNLSNTVLEAMNAGKCIVRISSSFAEHKDLYSDVVLGPDVAHIVDRDQVVKELPKVLERLIRNPRLRMQAGEASRKQAHKYLQTWHDRIELEVGLLKDISRSAGNCRPASNHVDSRQYH